MEKVTVNRFPITLAQFLKWAGLVLTGGEAKELVRAGLVKINGAVCQAPGQQLSPGDLIELTGEETAEYMAVKEEN